MQDERYVASADLGSGKIAISVAKIVGDDIQIIYYKETPSEGIRHSLVFNPKKASDSLRLAVREAENELNIKIRQIVVGLPRCDIHQEVAPARLERSEPDTCITLEEIVALKNMALDDYPLQDASKEEIYGAVAQSFSAEDLINQTEDDITGTISDILEGNFKIFVGSKSAIKNINMMSTLAEIALGRQYFVPDAVAKAVLTSGEMDNGVALVEIGSGVTSLTIYHGGILRYYYAIPFGGNIITTDIKYECGFKEALAENIKLAFGSCQPDKLQTMSDKILQINDEESGGYEHLSVSYLSQIINARAQEIIEAILFLIQESGYADKLRDGVVLTGGGANLVGLSSLFKEMSGYCVRMGFPRISKFCSAACPGVGETSAAASIGLILKAKEDKYINCIEDRPVIVKDEEAEIEEEIKDSVFDKNYGVIEPSREGEGNHKKPKKPKGKITWGSKLANKLSSAFESSTLGNLYDEMGKE